ncbi:MAG: TonB-dependent receptor, partial [Gammaproteobacteria bacterium]|nr:TonB-dependent receptor [Gammaproteobacteria bacterium]
LSNNRSELDFNNLGFTSGNISEDYELNNLVFNWDITPDMTLISATSYQERSATSPTDVSGWVPIVETFFPGTTIFAPAFGREITVDQPVEQIGFEFPSLVESFNHETRLVGTYNDNIYYTVGFSYKDQDFSTDAFSVFFPDPNATGSVAHAVDATFSTEALAIFADVSYVINDAWEVTFGARQYSDDRESDAKGFSFGRVRDFAGKTDNSELLFRAVAKWNYADDQMAYLSVAEGFRSGGLQDSETEEASGGLVPNFYDPEELITYEIGAKGKLLNGKLRYETAAYIQDYTEIQIVEPVLILSAVVNGGEAEIIGFEAALSYDVTNNLFFNLSYSHNDSELLHETAQHKKGEPFDNVPINDTLSVSADYSFNWAAGVGGHLRVDYFDRDGSVNNIKTGNFDILNQQHEGVNMLNARLGFLRDEWSFYLYAENITNEEQQVRKPFRGQIDYLIQQPRTIGATLRWKF